MADVIVLADAHTVSGTGPASIKQNILEAVDVSAYKEIYLQIKLLGASGANGIKVTILTSMQNKADDNSWVSAGQSDTVASTPGWVKLAVPTSGNVLFRYIRYQIDLQSGTDSASFSITGLAHRQ